MWSREGHEVGGSRATLELNPGTRDASSGGQTAQQLAASFRFFRAREVVRCEMRGSRSAGDIPDAGAPSLILARAMRLDFGNPSKDVAWLWLAGKASRVLRILYY